MTNKKAIQILTKAIDLLNKGFVKGSLATDKNGNDVSCKSRRAVNFCAEGAIRRLTRSNREVLIDLVKSENHLGQFQYLSTINDSSDGKRKVIGLFKNTIKLLEKEA